MIYTGEITFLIPSSYFMAGLAEIGGGQMVSPKLEETLELILDRSVGTPWLPVIASTHYVILPSWC